MRERRLRTSLMPPMDLSTRSTRRIDGKRGPQGPNAWRQGQGLEDFTGYAKTPVEPIS